MHLILGFVVLAGLVAVPIYAAAMVEYGLWPMVFGYIPLLALGFSARRVRSAGASLFLAVIATAGLMIWTVVIYNAINQADARAYMAEQERQQRQERMWRDIRQRQAR